ncbi:MAG TPA: DUF421 domain-containing protein [Propionibacterium sp.]|jgi:uncharacterized membrane protein YcaP (DUF421 family)|nr:DUF421 domain-containing protein [Propionibacterium sp.]
MADFLRWAWAELWPRIGIDALDAVAVALSTIVIYGFYVLLIRVLGQRLLARMSGFDAAAVVAVGAITGRVTLGHTPTLAAGAIALLTLFAMEAVVGEMRRFARAEHLFDNRAILLMIEGRIQEDLVRRAHVVEDELRSALRRAGLHQLEQAALVVLERTGELSITRSGSPIDPYLVEGVVGRERIPERLLEDLD